MLTDYQDSCSRVSDFGLSWNCRSIVYLSSQDKLCIPELSCFGIQLRYTSRHSSPPLSVHPLHLNCVLLDTGSGCASPLSIDGVACWCCYLVDFKGFNGPSRTNGARPLHTISCSLGTRDGRALKDIGNPRGRACQKSEVRGRKKK